MSLVFTQTRKGNVTTKKEVVVSVTEPTPSLGSPCLIGETSRTRSQPVSFCENEEDTIETALAGQPPLGVILECERSNTNSKTVGCQDGKLVTRTEWVHILHRDLAKQRRCRLAEPKPLFEGKGPRGQAIFLETIVHTTCQLEKRNLSDVTIRTDSAIPSAKSSRRKQRKANKKPLQTLVRSSSKKEERIGNQVSRPLSRSSDGTWGLTLSIRERELVEIGGTSGAPERSIATELSKRSPPPDDLRSHHLRKRRTRVFAPTTREVNL